MVASSPREKLMLDIHDLHLVFVVTGYLLRCLRHPLLVERTFRLVIFLHVFFDFVFLILLLGFCLPSNYYSMIPACCYQHYIVENVHRDQSWSVKDLNSSLLVGAIFGGCSLRQPQLAEFVATAGHHCFVVHQEDSVVLPTGNLSNVRLQTEGSDLRRLQPVFESTKT